MLVADAASAAIFVGNNNAITTYLCTHATFIPSIKFQKPFIPALLFAGAAVAAAIPFIFHYVAVIVVDVNGEYLLLLPCMDGHSVLVI